jgi:50S ribosomal protein L16 3-hydroxylase
MSSTTEYEKNTFEPSVFFGEHWRRKPLFVRGGAERFLGRRWSAADFAAALGAAREAGHPVADRDGEVTFVERVSQFNTDLDLRAKGFATEFGVLDAWFDTVRTEVPDGIGPHFDHSDNFVLQQEGVKEWSLAEPANIDRRVLAQRMLNTPGIGGHELPDTGVLHFTVEPGDLLYIPLLWLHSGVSRAASLSLSLVCPALSLNAAVIPILGQIARRRMLGHQAVPAFHAHMSDTERNDAAGILRAATENMLSRIGGTEFLEAVLAVQNDRLIGDQRP